MRAYSSFPCPCDTKGYLKHTLAASSSLRRSGNACSLSPCCEQRSGTGIYQATTLFSPKKPPFGPSAGRVAKATGAFAPCSVVRKPLCPFRSVATYPGLTELILIDVFRSSLAKKTVRALRAVLEALYARVGGRYEAYE